MCDLFVVANLLVHVKCFALVIHSTVMHNVSFGYSQDNASQ